MGSWSGWLISISLVNKGTVSPACMSFSVASLLQGTEDEVIDIRHGKRLHELAKLKSQPLWAEGHNHQVELQRVMVVCSRPSVNMTFCTGPAPGAEFCFDVSFGSMQNLEMADGYLPALKRFMKEVWPECNPR